MKRNLLFSIALLIAFSGCNGPEGTSSSATKPVADNSGSSESGMTVEEKADTKTVANSLELRSAAVETNSTFEFVNSTFESPVMLMAGDKPMNAGHSYPSPAMIDIDNDGVVEMVLGEIMGTVSYCENENQSGGDPVWSAVSPVLMADKKPLKLNNW